MNENDIMLMVLLYFCIVLPLGSLIIFFVADFISFLKNGKHIDF